MAFRKRNVGVQRTPSGNNADGSGEPEKDSAISPGIRPSPLTGQPTTSTGITNLDSYLGGHGGLATGSSIFIEESGTTDFSGAILKFFAAEGISQGHHVQIVGVGEQWVRELPGLAGAGDSSKSEKNTSSKDEDRMKIAWRYERLGQHDNSRPGGIAPNRTPVSAAKGVGDSDEAIFCHTFDLAKRLAIPPTSMIKHIPMTPLSSTSKPPFADVTRSIVVNIENSPENSTHRIIIPSILSPAFYPPHAGSPEHFLQFLHSLRAVLRQHANRVVAMITIPTELYRRSSGLVRWAEHLCDGVIELQPFPHIMDAASSLAESGGARSGEEQPQGMLKFHKLPALTERGANAAAGAGVGDDLSFTLSRRKFLIKPFSLPPLEREEGQTSQAADAAGSSALGQVKKADIEF
ncbi:PAXNEB-like protein [Elsinoe fawcettii]|nr:PAXNEB-like protein [Elsinoe fawcettii]